MYSIISFSGLFTRLKYLIIFCALSGALSAETNTPCSIVPVILERVEQMRGLAARQPITCLELEYKNYIKRTDVMQQKANKLEDLKIEENLYKALRIIPYNYPYTSCSYEGYGDTSLAFYDYEKKSITFRKGVSISHAVIAHELTHALQDQYYNIAKIMREKLSSDAVLATAAVREGDAMLVEDLYKNRFGETSTTGEPLIGTGLRKECEPPPVLQDIDLFPYDWGLILMDTVQKSTGFTGINRLLSNPVYQTSALFYPKAHKEPSTQLRHRRTTEDSLGEYILRRTLTQIVSKEQAIVAAKGLLYDTLKVTNYADSMQISWKLFFSSEAEQRQASPIIARYAAFLVDIPNIQEASYISMTNGTKKMQFSCRDLVCSLTLKIREKIKTLQLIR